MKKIISVIAAIFFIPLTVYANSAQMKWSGRTGYGTFVTDDECPVTVKNEVLTMDIGVFPDTWMDAEAAREYDAKVTAEYTFYNPSDYDVEATLAFPFGNAPRYSEYSPLIYGYDILLDGQPVEKEVRYTYSPDEFNIRTEIGKIYDRYREDEFFKPDMTVTKYVYRAEWSAESKNDFADVGMIWKNESDERKLYFESVNSYSSLDEKSASIYESVRENDDAVFYIIGRPPEKEPEMKCLVDGETGKGKVYLFEKTEMTFEEFVLNEWYGKNKDENISNTDIYNIAVDAFNRHSGDYGKNIISDFLNFGSLKDSIMMWYKYDISLPAGQTAVNSVTAPLYPSINLKMEPPVYGYEYLLSPAALWAEFGEIEININTPFYILESSIEGFEKTENGYVYKGKGLPQGELQLTMCREKVSVSDNDKSRNIAVTASVSALAVAAVVYAIRKRR